MFRRRHNHIEERSQKLTEEAKIAEAQKAQAESQQPVINRVTETLFYYHEQNHFTDYVLNLLAGGRR